VIPRSSRSHLNWKSSSARSSESPDKNLVTVQHQKKPSVYLIDRPGSINRSRPHRPPKSIRPRSRSRR
jgi:hypothetical protein